MKGLPFLRVVIMLDFLKAADVDSRSWPNTCSANTNKLISCQPNTSRTHTTHTHTAPIFNRHIRSVTHCRAGSGNKTLPVTLPIRSNVLRHIYVSPSYDPHTSHINARLTKEIHLPQSSPQETIFYSEHRWWCNWKQNQNCPTVKQSPCHCVKKLYSSWIRTESKMPIRRFQVKSQDVYISCPNVGKI